jgi:phospholipase/carboxylesterase
MVPLRDAPKVHHAGKPVLIISGRYNPIVAASNSAQLARVLVNTGATVRTRALQQGHELSLAFG